MSKNDISGASDIFLNESLDYWLLYITSFFIITESMGSSEFYDNFISYQIKSGINDRIYGLYKRVCRLGIFDNERILEIGCGIGSLTYLLSHKVKKGKIEAVDISPKSIEFANKQLTRKNVIFTSSDILDFEPENLMFDKILLFDVLEHFPEENQVKVFEKIAKWMGHDSMLLINLPNPNYIQLYQKNNPEALQEIDNPVFLNRLSNILDITSLEIEYFETYSVWVKNDYQFLVVKKKSAFVKKELSQQRNIVKKIYLRLGRELRKIFYNYPKE
jgi:trans-aconitate 2-methyltransferase